VRLNQLITFLRHLIQVTTNAETEIRPFGVTVIPV
jgi:hypothetical protein